MRGVSGAWKPARDWETEETAAAPAFAWSPAARQGPPLADASLPLGSGGRPRTELAADGASPPRLGLWIFLAAPPAAASARLWVSARRPRIPSLPDPPTRHLYLLQERAEGVEAGTASSSAQRGAVGPQPFPAAATALPGAALGWRAAAIARAAGGPGRVGGEGEERATSAGWEDTAALCPAGEEQPCSSQPREGGWAAEWGGVSGSKEWLPRRPGGSPPSASPPRPLVRPGAPP